MTSTPDQPVDPVRIVTGANRGIGLEIAKALAGKGRLVVVGRTQASSESARDAVLAAKPGVDVIAMHADFGSLDEVRQLGHALADTYESIDRFVHNAAIVASSRTLSSDGHELQFQVNHLAPFLLTALVEAPLVAASGRVIVVASEAHRRGTLDPDDLGFERRRYAAGRAYSQSKLANVMFTYALSRRWWKRVSINAVHPGVVSTRLLGSMFGMLSPLRFMFRSTEAGAAPVVRLSEDESLAGVSGSYYKRFDAVKTSAPSYDKLLQQALWDASEQMVGHRYAE